MLSFSRYFVFFTSSYVLLICLLSPPICFICFDRSVSISPCLSVFSNLNGFGQHFSPSYSQLTRLSAPFFSSFYCQLTFFPWQFPRLSLPCNCGAKFWVYAFRRSLQGDSVCALPKFPLFISTFFYFVCILLIPPRTAFFVTAQSHFSVAEGAAWVSEFYALTVPVH